MGYKKWLEEITLRTVKTNKQRNLILLQVCMLMVMPLCFLGWLYVGDGGTKRMLGEMDFYTALFVGIAVVGSVSIWFQFYLRPRIIHSLLRNALAGFGLNEVQGTTFRGFKGTYKGYFIQMQHSVARFKVVLYFMPFADNHGRINRRALQRMADEYCFSALFSSANLLVEPAYLLATDRIDSFFCIYHTKRYINKLVAIAERENLQPLTEEEWKRLVSLGRTEFEEAVTI